MLNYINMKAKNLYFINLNNFPFFITFLFFILCIENICEKNRKFINLLSQIHLVINGKGNQSLLNNAFYPEPYKVYVNSLYEDSCKKFCVMEYEINHITLIFNETIVSSENMFYGSNNMTEIDLSKFDFSRVVNASFMFRGCTNLKKINFENINTSSVINMKGLFHTCETLTSINLSNFDTSLVTIMEGMFYLCSNLISIDLTNFNTTRVKSFRLLFYKCTKLTEINLSNFDTSSVTNMEYMFYICSNLLSIDLSNFNTKNVETMGTLFGNCTKLKSLDISNFNTTKVKNIAYIFYFCTSIKKIKLGNFDTSSVKDMRCLFYHNNQLESIDLSSFDTSKVTLMGWMFFHCYNIKRIILSEKFNTSNVISMYSMFSHCKALDYLNLSSFDTTKVTEMNFMFNNDINLKYLDIPHFSPLNITTIESMFNNMISLTYLNIYLFEINNQTNKKTSFSKLKNDLKICSNEYNMYNYLLNLSLNNNCSDICFSKKNIKVDPVKKECIDSCKDNEYNYEYNNICYHECPEGTHIILKDIRNKDNIFIEFDDGVAICLDKQPEGYYLDENGFYRECYKGCKFCYGPGEKEAHNCIECKSNFLLINNLVNNTNCYEQCQYYYYFNESEDYMCTENNFCPNNYPKLINEKARCIDKCENDNIYKYEYDNICFEKCPKGTIKSSRIYHCLGNKNIYLNDIKTNEDIYHQLIDNIINNIDMSKGEEMIYEGLNNFFFHITNVENELDILDGKTNNTNKLSIIDLRKCENILKNHYDINENASLIIMKYEKISNISLERALQYEVYEPYNKTKLNMSLCYGDIDIYIPVILSEKTQKLYNELKEMGYDLFDINSPFYNDICIPYKSPEGTDVLLSDRVNYYYNNDDTSCQSNCKFSEYLMESQYLKCECDSKNSEIIINKAESFSGKSIYQSFYDVLKYSNYKVLKCIKLAFSINSFTISNIGSIITIAYFLFYFVFLIIFAIFGIKQLKLDLNKNILNSNSNIDNIKKDMTEINGNKDNDSKKNGEKLRKLKKKKKLKYKKNNKKNNEEISNNNRPKKKISIYTKSKLKFENKIEDIKNIDNISSVSKNILLNFNSNRDLNNKNIDNKEIDINKYEQSQIFEFDNYELNNLEYDCAKKFDKRNFLQIYLSLLKREHIVIFTFITKDDHNITFVKYSRFFFLLCTDMAMNVFFFADETMHKMFLDYGKYNFIQQIPQIIYSTSITQIIEIFICYLSLTDKHFYQIKEYKRINKTFLMKIMTCIKIKILIFFAFTLLIFMFYWYLITCFCAVYQNTQIAFIKDSISSFALGILLPFITYIFPTLFRIISLKSQSNMKFVYKFSNIFPIF